MSSAPKKKRKVDNSPNRLFLSYLKTWRDDAGATESKAFHVYNKAFKSMSKYPLPLLNGKEAVIIENIGDKIASMLDAKLKKEAEVAGITTREYLENSRKVDSSWWEKLEEDKPGKPQVKARKQNKNITGSQRKRNYIPVKNSGPYALLVALYQDSVSPSSVGFMKKADLLRAAQPYCSKSFTIADQGSQYTAWSSMATLLNKELAKKSGNPARYEITPSGTELAQKLLNADKLSQDAATKSKKFSSRTCIEDFCINKDLPGGNKPTSHNKENIVDLTLSESDTEMEQKIPDKSSFPPVTCTSSDPSTQKASLFSLKPGQFKVMLCIDTREVRGDNRKKEMRRELEKLEVESVEKVLQVGDFVWVAQETAVSTSPPRALVLDYVVERKCMSDLAQSIRDGRFHEQKIRLKQCGVKNIIYLVEDLKQIQHQSLPEKTLRQALHNTRITDGILVKYSENIKSTAEYLAIMTRHLKKMFEEKHLHAKSEFETCIGSECHLQTIDDFNEGSTKCKGLTITEMFYKFLMQIHGMSFDKAQAIASVYETPILLFQAYEQCSSVKDREQLLSKIKCGLLQRNLGINLSQVVYRTMFSE